MHPIAERVEPIGAIENDDAIALPDVRYDQLVQGWIILQSFIPFRLVKLSLMSTILLTDQSVNSIVDISSFENEQPETWRE
jgi:hypothetical protein